MRAILHVDMDAFYASVEQLDRPEFQGKPVIVGADPKEGRGRGVVAACSYEARTFGIRSAMPITRAWRLCPEGIYVRPRMGRYREVSAQVMEILHRFTDLVEPLSIDEAFLDVTGSIALFGPPGEIARAIKQEIRRATELTASVGCAPNKFLAKLASDLQKPDGLVIVHEEAVGAFLDELQISRLWGVGPKTERRLHDMGIRTIGQLSKIPREVLVRTYGAAGDHLWHLARGQDDRPVVPEWEPKSMSSETTFDEDTRDRELLVLTIQELADHVAARLRRENYRARKVTLKLRYANFSTHTKQASLDNAVQTGSEIFRVAQRLFDQFPLDQKIRLIGVGAGELSKAGETPEQLALFTDSNRQEKLDRSLDRIREKFGDSSVQRGSKLS